MNVNASADKKNHDLTGDNEHKQNWSSVDIVPSTTSIAHTPTPPPPDQQIPLPSFGNLTQIDENNEVAIEKKKKITLNKNNRNKNNVNVNILFSKYNYNREIYANTE